MYVITRMRKPKQFLQRSAKCKDMLSTPGRWQGGEGHAPLDFHTLLNLLNFKNSSIVSTVVNTRSILVAPPPEKFSADALLSTVCEIAK